MVGRIKNFTHRTRFEKLWFLPVCVLLIFSRIGIALTPFRYLSKRLGTKADKSPWTPLTSHTQETQAKLIAHTIELATRFIPFKINCFPQALTARILLALYGIPYCLYFGVRRDKQSTKAHAWVASGHIIVTGAREAKQFTIIACYAGQTSSNAEPIRQ